MKKPYSRAEPSARYTALQALYGRMHVEGDRALGLAAADTFAGTSLLRHVQAIKQLVAETGAKRLLDYGSGKASQYRPMPVIIGGRKVADGVAEYWDVDEVRCYDPGYAPYRELPGESFDGVVCTDVLEHCPEEDLPWIIEELFSFASRFVFLNLACSPAKKHLPDGSNAHITVRPPQWWRDLIAAHAPQGVIWELRAAAPGPDGIEEIVYRNGVHHADGVCVVPLEEGEARFATPNPGTRWRVETLYTKEPVTIEWLRVMPRGAVFYDVGANVGMYSIFAGLAREATVFAFEPESQNYALLNRNIALNGLEARIAAYCVALSDEAAVDRLYLSMQEAGGSCHSFAAEVGFDLKPRAAGFRQGCLSLPLDELVRLGRMPPPQYVKIDVDGFEHKVLRGMKAILGSPDLRSLIVELNPHLPEHREARSALAELGWRWEAEQVARAARRTGPFEGVAEHVFTR